MGTSSKTSIGLTWYQGISDGGQPVIDYRVWYKEEGGEYSVLQDNWYMTSFTASDLVMGTTYTFKVHARNSMGYSGDSNEITVIAAAKPSKPYSPTSSFANDIVTISWPLPTTNGADIISYSIKIRHSNMATYSEELTYCDGTD